MEDTNTLTPVLREAVDVFKMILFKALKGRLTERHPDADVSHLNQLTGATVNALFGVVNDAEPHARFAHAHGPEIQQALERLAADHQELREPLTDALRVQFLCDADDGIDSEHILRQADALGLLVPDRETPLPKTFMHLARVLGIAHGILDPQGNNSAPDTA